MNSSVAVCRGGSRWPAVSLMVSACVVALFALPGMAGVCEWQRSAVLSGEWWRFLSGHLTHTSGVNLAWNLAAFLGLGAICEFQDRRRFVLTTLLAVAAVPLAVLIATPEMSAYRGLSGIASALFGLLLVTVLRRAREQGRRELVWILWLAGLLFLGKIVYEVCVGQALFAVDSSGFVPLPVAHLAGAAAGILVGCTVPGQRLPNG